VPGDISMCSEAATEERERKVEKNENENRNASGAVWTSRTESIVMSSGLVTLLTGKERKSGWTTSGQSGQGVNDERPGKSSI
jgi:hypothetical protein